MKPTVWTKVVAALVSAALLGGELLAQGKVGCATNQYETWLHKIDPEMRARQAQIAAAVDPVLAGLRGEELSRRSAEVVIPCVVHVVFRTAAENISDAQIQSQIDVLNQDFTATNADIGGVPASFASVTGSPRIRFALAQRDPDCNPTTGITRTMTNVASFEVPTSAIYDAVKSAADGGADAWPSDRYLNMWVCNLAGGVIGYATPPGAPAHLDGVVMSFNVFGTTGAVRPPFHLGRTTTHEVGHWLGLCHIWGCSNDCAGCAVDDGILDTPVQDCPNFGCPPSPTFSCAGEPNGDMFMNFMDYVDDPCMFMFSVDQTLLMEAVLATNRASVASSNAHVPPTASADLWVEDDVDDNGSEPNTTSTNFYYSTAIWVRNAADGELVHQNPVYNPAAPNHVYVRVRNSGCAASAPATLRLYWAKASTGLSWPAPWDGSVTAPALMGGPIGSQSTGAVPGGGSVVLEFPWSPPDPGNYAAFGAERSHFCLLARIETSPTAPYGMTSAEGNNLWRNVRNNNNIAWKNLTVLGGTGGRSGFAMAANYGAVAEEFEFEVHFLEGLAKQVSPGSVKLRITPALAQAWIAGGAQASGMKFSAPESAFYVVASGAAFGPVKMQPGDVSVLELMLDPEVRSGPQTTTRLRVQQMRRGRREIVGGQDFVIPIGAPLDNAYVQVYGAGCPDSRGRIPLLSGLGVPRLGNKQFALEMAGAVSNAPAALFLGVAPLQLPLGKCLLLTSPVVSLNALTDADGRVVWKLPIVSNPELTGASLYLQAAVIDRALPTLFCLTNGLEAGLGL